MSERPVATSTDEGGQVEELAARLAKNEADIGLLREEAVEATHRAGVVEGRAEGDRARIEALEARAVVDKEMLEELRADGILNKDHAANLEAALQSSRLIGAATGIIMAKRTLNETKAFATLKTASQHSNRKLRAVAEDVVLTGDVSELPT